MSTHVNMAAHERRTEECEQLGRLYENHPCLYNTTNKNYKDKDKRMGAFSDNNYSGSLHKVTSIFLLLCKQHYALKAKVSEVKVHSRVHQTLSGSVSGKCCIRFCLI